MTDSAKRRRPYLVVAAVLATATLVLVAFLARRDGQGHKGPPGESPGAGTRPTPTVVRVSGSQASHDFGLVELKGKRHVVFAIRSSSGQPLTVRGIRNTCKCLAVADVPKTIPAAEPARMRVDFIAPKKPIEYDEKVALLTTDPQTPIILLRIKARVGLPVYVENPKLDMGALVAGRQRSASIVLVNLGDEPVQPIYAVSSSPNCTARVSRAPVPPRGRLAIPVCVRTEGVSPGKGRATVTVHTVGPGASRHTAQVTWRVSQAQSPLPSDKRAPGAFDGPSANPS